MNRATVILVLLIVPQMRGHVAKVKCQSCGTASADSSSQSPSASAAISQRLNVSAACLLAAQS